MSKASDLYIGDTAFNKDNLNSEGEIVKIDGIKFYKIKHVDQMPPFFMTLTGAGNHWMFVSSNGGLTAGRREAGNALFPYSTDDKITDSAGITGSKTILRIQQEKKEFLWEPFSKQYEGLYNIERNLYKSIFGNVLLFEEINHSHKIAFSYKWQFSDSFGFVKTSIIQNLSGTRRNIALMDGLLNIMPYGVNEGMQMRYSTLVDAYKKNELDPQSGLGIYYLSSIPTDRAEPSEGLMATTVWSAGLDNSIKLVSDDQIKAFRYGGEIKQETDIRGRRGAYFISDQVSIDANNHLSWIAVAELEQDTASVFELKKLLESPVNLAREVNEDLAKGTVKLLELTGMSDGIQLVEDDLVSSRHFSNVLFNIMRGGIFHNSYTIFRQDLIEFIRHFNKAISVLYEEKICSMLPEHFEYPELTTFASETGNPDLRRLCYEFLPLTFGRRHGDPSRPWNRFFIPDLNPDGSRKIDYQGNWRDIFQNWEALAYSFPEFTEGMICRFLNASTADGYNPYRITKEGIDWEVIDPDDPWSNIGYWGDHQIIYLLKLLEISDKFHPGKLTQWLTEECFVYANVPYRIKSYPEKISDPRNTIIYDADEELRINMRVSQYGADGKLIWLREGPYTVNMSEKLLVPLLAKLSNFVADGGIWLSNQRPEWNDANNAIVGNGLSMVTVYYLHRHLAFLLRLFESLESSHLQISDEVIIWLKSIHKAFSNNRTILKEEATSLQRRKLLDELGRAADNYQEAIYSRGFSGIKSSFARADLLNFLSLVKEFVQASVQHNQREDKLFHAYNLMKPESDGGISVVNLYEMLEGQVAVLSSGILSASQALEVLIALRNSSMYRSDQQSYTLYPNHDLPRFLEKNQISEAEISSSALLGECIKRKDHRIVKPIKKGLYQFNGTFRNSKDLVDVLDAMKEDYTAEIIQQEKEKLVQLFEDTFDHHLFTGRSGTFFKYEGLGSIYWHMVAKLALAIQEIYFRAIETNEDESVINQLANFYHEVKVSMGLHKNPGDYGAFPIDPYSHTPEHCGAQQPGMTGQVKEDILSRWGELGVFITDGQIQFRPLLLRKEEFLNSRDTYTFNAIEGEINKIEVPEKYITFTYCQVPILYKLGENDELNVFTNSNQIINVRSLKLSSELSGEVFRRTGKIEKIEVSLCDSKVG